MSMLKSSLARRIALALTDLALLAIAWFSAYMIRQMLGSESMPLDKFPNPDYFDQMRVLLPWVALVHLGTFFLFKVYQGVLRYVSITELRAILAASCVTVGLLIGWNILAEGRESFLFMPVVGTLEGGTRVFRIPYGILLIYFMLSVMMTGGLRFSWRLWSEGRRRFDDDAQATLIVGAGDLAERTLRELLQSESSSFRPVCIVAKEPSRLGLKIHGTQVRGTIADIPQFLHDDQIGTVLIALDDDDPDVLSQVVQHCHEAKVAFHLIPTIRDVSSGRVEIRPLRRVKIEDLLGREPIDLHLPDERNYLRDEVVLITGAGGSIGSELCRQVAWCKPSVMILVGKGENSIHGIYHELKDLHPELLVCPLVADIRDENGMLRLFQIYRPTVVFHAAAHKHVPLMEVQPAEAVKNNVFGTAVVAFMAHQFAVKRFVLISSDKAVRPTSVMGATKRLAEMIVFSLAKQSGTIFQAVRFGNVLGSRGSVIPIFERQIAAGGPVTVTHPEVTRFFMTIPEAVNLVLQAGSNDGQGALYLLDMGKPVKVLDLVKNLITLSGLKVGTDIEIRFTGLRPGEKLHEELLTEGENIESTEIPKISRTMPFDVPGWADIQTLLLELREMAEHSDAASVLKRLRSVIDDYHPGELAELTDEQALAAKFEKARLNVERSSENARFSLGLLAEASVPKSIVIESPAPSSTAQPELFPQDQNEIPTEPGVHPAVVRKSGDELVQPIAETPVEPESEDTEPPASEMQMGTDAVSVTFHEHETLEEHPEEDAPVAIVPESAPEESLVSEESASVDEEEPIEPAPELPAVGSEEISSEESKVEPDTVNVQSVAFREPPIEGGESDTSVPVPPTDIVPEASDLVSEDELPSDELIDETLSEQVAEDPVLEEPAVEDDIPMADLLADAFGDEMGAAPADDTPESEPESQPEPVAEAEPAPERIEEQQDLDGSPSKEDEDSIESSDDIVELTLEAEEVEEESISESDSEPIDTPPLEPESVPVQEELSGESHSPDKVGQPDMFDDSQEKTEEGESTSKEVHLDWTDGETGTPYQTGMEDDFELSPIKIPSPDDEDEESPVSEKILEDERLTPDPVSVDLLADMQGLPRENIRMHDTTEIAVHKLDFNTPRSMRHEVPPVDEDDEDDGNETLTEEESLEARRALERTRRDLELSGAGATPLPLPSQVLSGLAGEPNYTDTSTDELLHAHDISREDREAFQQRHEARRAGPVTCTFFALVEDVAPRARQEFFQHLAIRMDATSRLVVSGVSDLKIIPKSIHARTTILPTDLVTAPERWNAAASFAPEDSLLISVSPDVRLVPDFCERVRNVAGGRPNCYLFYSDYIESSDEEEKSIALHDHQGCPHERFEFGPVLMYRSRAIHALGGFNESLRHAWEYDMHLRLMQEGLFHRVSPALYKVLKPSRDEATSDVLHSPGRGVLGGFSYVFYPEDVEAEVTAVFERALKEIGAWLDQPTVEVPQPKDKPAVMGSVVIPVLNRAKYIGNAIEKVIEGTAQDFEIVVVDNGSTDGTIKIVEEWAAKDDRVRLVHGTGKSIASALNEGIRAARGKYICQLDSDDEYVPETLEKMIAQLESNPKCGLAISYYRLMDEKGRVIEDVPPVQHTGYTRNQILRRDGAGAVRVFPKAVLEEFGLYDEIQFGNFGEDYDMVLKVGEKYDVDRVHEVLYHYRRHADNTDVTRDPEMKYHNKNNARQQALIRRMELNDKRTHVKEPKRDGE